MFSKAFRCEACQELACLVVAGRNVPIAENDGGHVAGARVLIGPFLRDLLVINLERPSEYSANREFGSVLVPAITLLGQRTGTGAERVKADLLDKLAITALRDQIEPRKPRGSGPVTPTLKISCGFRHTVRSEDIQQGLAINTDVTRIGEGAK